MRHEQQLVGGAERREQALHDAPGGGGERPALGVGRSHAARHVHQRDQRARGRAVTRRAALHARPRHRHGEQRDRERAQRQQQPLLQAQPADLALVHLGQELERGEAHLARLAACEQVDQDRDGRCRKPEQEQRVQEVHGADPLARVPGRAIRRTGSASAARRRPTARSRSPGGSPSRCAAPDRSPAARSTGCGRTGGRRAASR